MKRFISFALLFLITASTYAQLSTQLIHHNINISNQTQLVDFNNDGLEDIIVLIQDSIFVIENTMNGYASPHLIFTRLNSFGSPIPLSHMNWGDFNGDSYPDLLVAEEDYVFTPNGPIRTYLNLQNRSLSSSGALIRSTSRLSPGSLNSNIEDFDGDGDLDIAITQENGTVSGNFFPILCMNNGIGTNWTIITPALNTLSFNRPGVQVFKFGLIDNDTIPDLIIDEEFSFGDLFYLKGLGNNSYSTPIAMGVRGQYATVLPRDIDVDGDTDIIAFGPVVAQNDGAGNFSIQNISAIGNRDPIAFEDIDQDGIKDIIAKRLTTIYWYKGLVTPGSFGTEQVLGTNIGNVIDISDRTNDQVIDFHSVSGNSLFFHKNFLNSAFKLSGQLFFDVNQNKIRDANERTLPFLGVDVFPSSGKVLSSDGMYSFHTDSGRHTVTYKPVANWSLTTDSTSYTANFTSTFTERDSLDFGFYPSQVFTNIAASINGGFPRCDAPVVFWFSIKNEGTSTPSGRVELQLDDSIQFVSSVIPPDSISGGKLFWNYDSLDFFETRRWSINVKMPDFNSLGDTLTNYLNVKEIVGENVVYSTQDTLSQELRCSYDPNDKSVEPQGFDSLGYVSSNQELTYLIRFQNTGNDTAFHVSIRDVLDTDLDKSTFELIASSHTMNLTLNKDGELVFDFPNINLLDSNANEPESHGFVKYKISPNGNIVPKTTISNTANIFFDSNPAIITNTVINTIECLGPIKPIINAISPMVLSISITGNYTIQWYLNDSLLVGRVNDTIQPNLSGNYTVELTDSNGCSVVSDQYVYTAVGLESLSKIEAQLYPNPFTNELTIEFSEPLKEPVMINIFNSLGQLVKQSTRSSSNRLMLQKGNLSEGIYWLTIQYDLSKKIILRELIIIK